MEVTKLVTIQRMKVRSAQHFQDDAVLDKSWWIKFKWQRSLGWLWPGLTSDIKTDPEISASTYFDACWCKKYNRGVCMLVLKMIVLETIPSRYLARETIIISVIDYYDRYWKCLCLRRTSQWTYAEFFTISWIFDCNEGNSSFLGAGAPVWDQFSKSAVMYGQVASGTECKLVFNGQLTWPKRCCFGHPNEHTRSQSSVSASVYYSHHVLERSYWVIYPIRLHWCEWA